MTRMVQVAVAGDVTEGEELQAILTAVGIDSQLQTEGEDDPLTVLLELLHDVPAGKLAIAEFRDATPDDVAELERSGVDAVLVWHTRFPELIQAGPPEV